MEKQMIALVAIIATFATICGAFGFKAGSEAGKQYLYMRTIERGFPKQNRILVIYPEGKAELIKLEGKTFDDDCVTIAAKINKFNKEGYELVSNTAVTTESFSITSTFLFQKQ